MLIEQPPDLELKFSFLESRPSSMSVVQSTETETEQNVVQVPPEFRFYAFLDLVEEAYSAMFDQQPPMADLSPMGDLESSPESLGLGYEDRSEHPDIVVAHFDCVSCVYFDDALVHYRQYYDENWSGGEIDRAHNLDAPLWRSPEQSAGHQRLNYALNTEGPYKEIPRALGVYLIFENTAANWHRFRYYFPEDGWYGLGLSYRTGFPVEVWFGDEDLGQSSRDYGLVNIYDLSQQKRNHLHHVYSLDFASDAYIGPEHDVPPEPIPFLAPLPLPSGSGQPGQSQGKKKLYRKKQLRKRQNESFGLIRKRIYKKPISKEKLLLIIGQGQLVVGQGTLIQIGSSRLIIVK